MLYKREGSNFWWIRFKFRGNLIQRSSKVTNKREAQQIEAAHKTALAKGEVGIVDRKAAPTLARFIDDDLLPYIRSHHAEKPKTVTAYEYHSKILKANYGLATTPLDRISEKMAAAHAAARRADGFEVSTCNRDLATLRRIFKLAVEWNVIGRAPKIALLPGENRREHVVTEAEEKKYLKACPPLLKDVATLLFDLGLRPEELFRLKPENVLPGPSPGQASVEIHKGKGVGSRRRIPCSARAVKILTDRTRRNESGWLFPAPTKSGHIDGSSVKKQHAKALRDSGVVPFVLYDIRHTCITRWSKKVDAFTLHYLAGHVSMATTARYVHVSAEATRGILKP